MGTWNLKLQFQQGIKLDSSGGMEQGKTKTSVIVTDFAVMTNCNRIVLSTSSRELVFYDMSTRKFQCQYRLHGRLATELGARDRAQANLGLGL